MDSTVHQQPFALFSFDSEQKQIKSQTTKNDAAIVEQGLSSRNNFPKGLRGGGPCFDCLACLCCCCAIEDIACFECCKDC